MAAPAAPVGRRPPSPIAVVRPWLNSLSPVYRLIVRWALIASLTLLAFHESLTSLIEETRASNLNGYVWTVPVAGIFAAIGVARRNRTELPIHDRQTDVIVAIMGLVLAWLFLGVLAPRFAAYFNLIRLDLVSMWMFVVSASVALFGLRPVARFGWVWALLFMVFPLPYHVTVIALGGTKVAASVGTMVIAGVAAGIATGRRVGPTVAGSRYTRATIGSGAAWLIGLVMLAGMAVFFPDAPWLAYQQIPALSSIVLAGLALYLYERRGQPKTLLDRRIEPLAARDVWAAIPVVAAVAVALSVIGLPVIPRSPMLRIATLTFDQPLPAPTGWQTTDIRSYDWVSRMYGNRAVLVRQRTTAEVGDPRWDKFARPRTVMVDALTTYRSTSLQTYPSRLIYDVKNTRTSEPRMVDLGYGVMGRILSVVDDRILLTWTILEWSWTNGPVAQRILVISVDNHEPDALFPEPQGGLGSTLASLFTVLLRGNAAALDENPNRKDDEMLTEFSHGLVRAKLEPLGVEP